MPRSDSIQRPTTLLSLTSTKEELSVAPFQIHEQNRLIFDSTPDGVLTGDVRFSTGKAGANDDKTYPLLPVGSLIYYAGTEPPAGYIFCNGALYRKDLYIELYNYLGAADPDSPYHWRYDTSLFKVPDFSNSGNPDKSREKNRQGGLFIRNLNPHLPTGNPSLPDYYNEFWDEMNVGEHNVGENTTQNKNARTFGSIQEEQYPYHNHKHLTANTSETGENHSHKYFVSEDSHNGIPLGELNSLGAENAEIVVRSGLATTDAGAIYDLQPDGVTPRALPTVDLEGIPPETIAQLLADGDLAPFTGQDFDVGAHVHTGWLGFGASKYKTDSMHNTYHRSANSEYRQDYTITSNTYNIVSNSYLTNYFELNVETNIVGANREKTYASTYRMWPHRTSVYIIPPGGTDADRVLQKEGIDYSYSYNNMSLTFVESPLESAIIKIEILLNESEYYELYKNNILLELNKDYIVDSDDLSITLYDQTFIGDTLRLMDLSNFNNATETQPKNYSLLFCIKY